MKLSIKSLLLIASAALFLTACSEPTIPKEGKQYTSLPEPITDKTFAPVTEVFSLTCGHCRNMEKFITQISAQADTAIDKLHITFNQSAYKAAMLYYTAEIQLNRAPDAAFMDELFAAVQIPNSVAAEQKKQAIEKAFSSRNLLNPQQLSKQQNNKLMRKVNHVRRLSAQSGINSVPTFIINGRYQLLVGGHKSPTEIADTISYLLKK